MVALRNLAVLAGRILIAAIFIYDATLIARFPADNAGFLEGFGVPSFMIWPTALLQFAGGLGIVVGLLTRIFALAFAAFCILTALIFHNNFADLGETIQFGKDLGLAGGFLFLAAGGAGEWSLDAILGTDGWPFARGRTRTAT
jgi:putative oxidoreductase